MKFFSALTLLAVFLFAFQGCSDDPPTLRVRNDFTKKANLQFKPSVGSTFNINDVEAGAATEYRDIAEATFIVTATIQGETEAPTAEFTSKNNYRYTIVVTNDNPPTLRTESEER